MGDWLPTSVFGYLHALCAYLRMIYVALYLVFLSGAEYDVVFCDQVGDTPSTFFFSSLQHNSVHYLFMLTLTFTLVFFALTFL